MEFVHLRHEGNFQHHFVCLFFARRLYQNYARVSHVMAQLFRWNQPIIVSLPRRYLVAFSYPDYSKLSSNWHTYINPRPGQYLTQGQSHITRALADICRHLSRPRGVLIRIFCKSCIIFFGSKSCL